MISPTPPGTRDMLPDEMRELRALSDRLRVAFEEAGYGEVWTPSLEYEDVLVRGDDNGARAGFRMFDEQGRVLALRSDMTIPIARLVASRYADAPPPLRLSYFAHSYRAVSRGQVQSREFLQAGVELIGASGPDGDAEVIGLVLEGLALAGLTRHRVGIGDGSLYRSLLERAGVEADDRRRLLDHLTGRDLVSLEMGLRRLDLPEQLVDELVALPTLRGGVEVLDRAGPDAGQVVDGLRSLYTRLDERGLGARVIFDLGLVRDLSYYSGPVFEVYDPAVGYTIGGGGRYDELLGRFGRSLPACGMALDLERVHAAAAAEERMPEEETTE